MHWRGLDLARPPQVTSPVHTDRAPRVQRMTSGQGQGSLGRTITTRALEWMGYWVREWPPHVGDGWSPGFPQPPLGSRRRQLPATGSQSPDGLQSKPSHENIYKTRS